MKAPVSPGSQVTVTAPEMEGQASPWELQRGMVMVPKVWDSHVSPSGQQMP